MQFFKSIAGRYVLYERIIRHPLRIKTGMRFIYVRMGVPEYFVYSPYVERPEGSRKSNLFSDQTSPALAPGASVGTVRNISYLIGTNFLMPCYNRW